MLELVEEYEKAYPID
ncbi:b751ce5a-bb6b-4e21-9357-46319de94a6b [Thermothielavioides terrestris]|uniref:B751ce5a-bb6b-4e21-9357-46319de94a6b n=1 Tax=Thermothielavioides terrestris TaxID=2587410 RepID=A0A3S4F1L4_9PEZI|nr:b751ce5a-bb6b-4e21-9357-46319de94a6b [Thermothielavioides terrestris]